MKSRLQYFIPYPSQKNKTVYFFVCCMLDNATSVTLEISETAVEEGSSVTFTCNTSSNPSPRLRLYRQREGHVTREVKTVTGVKLSWTDSVKSEDNKANFYCRVDDNKNIDEWNFDVQSVWWEFIVWCKYKMCFIVA